MPSAPQHAQPVIAPGLATMLRRHPARVRQAVAGMIVGGVLLLVTASVALPAGAEPGHKMAGPPVAIPAVADPIEPAAMDPAYAPLQPAAKKVPAGKPKKAAKKAPANKAVISGLSASGIPNVALNAYRVAAARLAGAEPGCGIDWALLAGIGRVESDHGRFAGATLNADGTSIPRIIGIPLDGSGTALITDTDGGRLDGDRVYDRAVGSMQFIPSTWARYGSDATGDGVADIFNINDAALSAARYLCAAGGNLRTLAGQTAAVLAYNHSDQYLAEVLALAHAYRTGVAVHGVPVGKVTGGLAPISHTGKVPPVNPGPPTALGKKAPAKKHAATRHPSTTPAKPPHSPGSSTPAAGSGGSTGGATGTSTPPTPSPTPSPTASSACLLWDLLDPNTCDLYI
jgi:membrane-bound lytic murein transglycosylase B